MTKIGICIKEFDSIFTNGCAQQGYFVLKSLRKSGFKADFVSIEDKLKYFEVINEPVYNICNIDILKQYHLIIFSSLIVDQFKLLNQMKLLGIKIANLMVGNFYIINCEEFVFNVHNNVIKDMNNEYVDEIWLMPMYRHAKEYIEGMTKKPVKISPYVWDNEIITKYAQLKNIKPEYKPIQNSQTIDIIIMEPNLSIHKTALPILVMLNRYFLLFPERLGTIHMFGIPKRNKDFLECISHLDIVKCKKIIPYQRTLSLEIFHRLRENNIKYIMISNNIRNGLNFIHLECLTLGIPIIHNCEPYKENGLFYEDSDRKTEYSKATQYINDIWSNKKLNDKKGSVDILLRYHSYNKKNVENYKILADNLLKTIKPNIFELNSVFKKNDIFNELTDGFVIVIPVDKLYEKRVLERSLNKLNETNVKQKVILYISNVRLDTDSLIKNNKNLDLEFINTFTDNIELYTIANTKYKYVCYLNQNTIAYMKPEDLKDTITRHQCLVSVKNNISYGKENDEKQFDFIDVIFKAFGKEFSRANLFDSKFFMYVNTPEIRFYFNNYLNNVKVRNLINRDYEITTLMSLISNKIVLIESKKKIVTNRMSDNNFYAFGYLISCNDIVIFMNIDPVLNKNINLNTKLIVDIKEDSIHTVNNILYRDIEYDKEYVILSS